MSVSSPLTRGTVLVGLAALLCGCVNSSRAAEGSGGGAARCESSVVFRSGTGGYHTFRIPAVVTTAPAPATPGAPGTLVAFAEARRHSQADAGDVDVVSRRSTDGGCTWSPLQVVADAGPDTVGNPVPVVVPGTGRLVLVTCRNAATATERTILEGKRPAGRRVYVQHSDTAGRTWSPPTEITDEATRPDWRWYATGPGHGLALTHGPHAGRLVVPADHSTAPPAGSPDTGAEPRYYGGHALLSDDGGATWRIGFADDTPDGRVNANETTAAQLPDGRVYFNTRDQHGTAPASRADAYSGDGGENLDGPFAPTEDVTAALSEGSVLQTRHGGHAGPLLLSAPAGPEARTDMTVRSSDDGGLTWSTGLRLTSDPAAYSDLVQAGPGTVGVLYETGRRTPYDTITFTRLPLDHLRAPN
ncbi:sialidase family protein [Streptomyces sp. NPDC006638]|uniref:sialidase family protein n=1 Tax=Streptomyces sp. NPDC006638 TaxID=3157183 RepID=UPI0033B21C03